MNGPGGPVGVGEPTSGPATPKPAASVVLVRPAGPGGPEPLEAYMIRRKKGMRFLAGYYAFPGGKVDPADAAPEALARVRGLAPAEAEGLLHDPDGLPALAYWVAALRELLEETGVLVACDAGGVPVDAADPVVAGAIADARDALMAGVPFAEVLARGGWYGDVRGLRYLSHYITPRTSPIRFSARFFLCPVPSGQAPALFTEETSEALWVPPAEGHRRFRLGEMAMAEPAEYGLAYLAQFGSLDEVWAAHADGRDKFQGLIHRIDVFWETFDWKAARWPAAPGWNPRA